MENRKGQQILPPLTITHVFYQVFLGEIQGKTAALKKRFRYGYARKNKGGNTTRCNIQQKTIT